MAERILGALEPQEVWYYFEEITKYPRPSKQEEKIAAYIKGWAVDQGFELQEDKLGNFVVRKPATPGMENRKPVCIQGHIDMVCEKNADVEFDFENDPIQVYIDGDWVKAKGTTLGADNGIGVAMGMAVMTTEGVKHPALELLCTLDEETGLTGAMQLGTDLLKAEILINLDSEEDGAFTIGCAGGLNTRGIYAYHADNVPGDTVAYTIAVKGLKGGHSGIEIHDGRGNAAKFLNRILWNATNKLNIRVADFNSGNKHNAIPREGFATVVVAKAAEGDFLKFIADFDQQYKREYGSKEPNVSITAEATAIPARVMTPEFQKRLLTSFYVMPHGVYRMSPDIAGLVQTSTNFAIVETKENTIEVLTSQRSSVETEKKDMAAVVQLSFELGGAEVKFGDGYPAWEPNVNSPILKEAVEVYTKLFGKEPHIEAIHAGLECGLVGEKYPNMDMLSFGPDLREVHSPNEMISITSTAKCWKLLKKILEEIPVKA
ncbi:MAG: cytosol nonspecific dipeptidase [Ignavibacteriae bacterium HGW-Ignavibacteriae-1]|jgi:dipeptidase D|nr:MAG: cytosol nonspecific dipeptidase [Ignavibacteriae bacterium HGW-Ignavibacteriae-1]